VTAAILNASVDDARQCSLSLALASATSKLLTSALISGISIPKSRVVSTTTTRLASNNAGLLRLRTDSLHARLSPSILTNLLTIASLHLRPFLALSLSIPLRHLLPLNLRTLLTLSLTIPLRHLLALDLWTLHLRHLTTFKLRTLCLLHLTPLELRPLHLRHLLALHLRHLLTLHLWTLGLLPHLRLRTLHLRHLSLGCLGRGNLCLAAAAAMTASASLTFALS